MGEIGPPAANIMYKKKHLPAYETGIARILDACSVEPPETIGVSDDSHLTGVCRSSDDELKNELASDSDMKTSSI